MRNKVRGSSSKRQTVPSSDSARKGLVLFSRHSKEGNRSVHRIHCPYERCWQENLSLGRIRGLSTKEKESSVSSGESWPATEREDLSAFLSFWNNRWVFWKKPGPEGWIVGVFYYLPAWQDMYYWKTLESYSFPTCMGLRGHGRKKLEISQTIE